MFIIIINIDIFMIYDPIYIYIYTPYLSKCMQYVVLLCFSLILLTVCHFSMILHILCYTSDISSGNSEMTFDSPGRKDSTKEAGSSEGIFGEEDVAWLLKGET